MANQKKNIKDEEIATVLTYKKIKKSTNTHKFQGRDIAYERLLADIRRNRYRLQNEARKKRSLVS